MAISPLFWNNGWSLQLSLSRIALDSPHSSDALCHSPCGAVLGGKKAFRNFKIAVGGLWLYSIYSETNQFLFCFFLFSLL